MLPKKLKIEYKNNIIESVEKSEISTVIIDGKTHEFPDSYTMQGLVDSHAHIVFLGMKLEDVNLDNAKSKEECLNIVKTIEAKKGWIIARGWNEENWTDSRKMDKNDLDEINREIPIFLIRVDGHAAWVNSKALEIAGITGTTTDPEGGKIVKDDSGEPTGILIDNAIELVRQKIPKPSKNEIKDYILSACNECIRSGLTEIHDMDVHLEHLESFIELDENDELPIRVVSYIRGFDDEYLHKDIKKYKGKNLEIKGLKFYADGALGSRGAAMLNGYKDAETKGLFLIEEEELKQKAEIACINGWGIAVHAIGDAANRMVLNVYEYLRNKGFKNILRVEHSQLVSPEDIHRFNKLNVIASVQPIHCTSDKKMAVKRLGENFKYAYPWKTLLNNDAVLIGGSDFPIESHDPFLGIDAFVNRIPQGESKSWQSEETISVDAALEAYNYYPHLASGNLDNRGVLEKGKQTDIILVNNSLTNSSVVKHTKTTATIINGKLHKFC